MGKRIAVICDYVLRPDRIGGMDRFYKLFHEKVTALGHNIDWYFTAYTRFDFFESLPITAVNTTSIEKTFIETSKHKSYDVIITHFTELCSSYYKEYNELHPNAKIIAVDHNPRPLKGFSFKKRIKKRIQGLQNGKYINQFVGVSKYTVYHILNDYGSFLKHKTTVVYNGVATDVFKKRTEENTNKFIVASHLRPSKGIQDLLKALSIIDEKILQNVTIDVYGEGPYQEELLAMTKRYNLSNVVLFKGSSPKLHELYANYSYMIQPTYMECFSLSVLESLSANIPVITTTVGGNLEVLQDGKNGFIYEPGDVIKLSEILKDILTKKRSINTDTSILVQKQFYLEKMVQDHINISL